MRGTLAMLLTALAVLTSDAQAPLTPEEAYRLYAAGDDTAVERLVAGLTPEENPVRNMAELAPRAPFTRIAAAFMLEVAAAHPNSARAGTALSRGREMVMARSTSLGMDPEEDRFEILWHQTAIGIAQHHRSIPTQHAYVSVLLPRFEEAARRGLVFATRFALARAVAEGAACCDPRSGRPINWSAGLFAETPTLASALRLFDRAAESAHVRDEALVRKGLLLFAARRFAEAEQTFGQVSAGVESALQYPFHLTRGRTLDALARTDEAVGAYTRALDAEPDGQLAGIGLAAAYLRLNRTDDATRAAERARRMPPLPGRGLRVVEMGDYRFVKDWLGEIRRLRR